MFARESRLYRFNLNMGQRLAADVRPDQLALEHASGVHSPLWVLGHLAVATDYAAQILGLERALPRRWHACFGPGSPSLPEKAHRPEKDQLVQAFVGGHERVLAAVAVADESRLVAPHDVAFLAGTPIETLADLLAHLMTTHEAFHLGQLSSWRRTMGFPPLF